MIVHFTELPLEPEEDPLPEPVPEPELRGVGVPLPEGELLSGEPLGDEPVPAELPGLELAVPGAEPLPVDELPAPLSGESWTPSALAVLLSNCPLCWMFCER